MLQQSKGGGMGAIPESLTGIGSRVSTAFRDLAAQRASSVPAAQLQGDLLHAADDITNNMSTLLRELGQGLNFRSHFFSVSRHLANEALLGGIKCL